MCLTFNLNFFSFSVNLHFEKVESNSVFLSSPHKQKQKQEQEAQPRKRFKQNG